MFIQWYRDGQLRISAEAVRALSEVIIAAEEEEGEVGEEEDERENGVEEEEKEDM